MGFALHSHFHVQPNYSVEIVLRCVVVGVVTILSSPIDQFNDRIQYFESCIKLEISALEPKLMLFKRRIMELKIFNKSCKYMRNWLPVRIIQNHKW